MGKIFDPAAHKLANGCVDYAQSPQTLEFDSFVRIYFSTRAKDATGKYLSHVAYVDMTKDLASVRGLSRHTIIPLGELGCYDEHGIFPFNVLRDGRRVLGYIGGWSRRVSVDIETSIGVSVSNDGGETFKRTGHGPVLTSSPTEPFLVGDPFVAKFGAAYHMWYIYGTHWINNPENNVKERVYKVGHATSADGFEWKKSEKQLIKDRLGEWECQALPSVVHHANRYHMVYCYREAIGFRTDPAKGYRLGYAHSSDLETWVRDDDALGLQVRPSEWDSDMQCYPHLFHCDGRVYLLYNGNHFGRYGFGAAMLES